MISKELNIGRAGQYLVLADLLLKGIQAYETAEGIEYDVVVDYEGRLIKIQVKTTQKMRLLNEHSNPVYFYHLKRAGKNGKRIYKINDFDCFALVALDIKKVFYLYFGERVGKNSVCIRDKKLIYTGQGKGGYKNGLYYQDLTWGNFLKEYNNK